LLALVFACFKEEVLSHDHLVTLTDSIRQVQVIPVFSSVKSHAFDELI